jgi:hypothetical protein
MISSTATAGSETRVEAHPGEEQSQRVNKQR